MIDVAPRQRNLLFGLAGTFVLASIGATGFHVRWHAGSAPTELLGWVIVIATAIASLTHLTLDEYGSPAAGREVWTYLAIAAGSAVMALFPFPFVNYLLQTSVITGQYDTYLTLLSCVLILAFVLAGCVYAFIERGASPE
jgi:hypothetical protein